MELNKDDTAKLDEYLQLDNGAPTENIVKYQALGARLCNMTAFTEVTGFLISAVVTLIVFCYIRVSNVYQYWKDRGISYLKPLPIVGNLLPVFSFKESMGEMYKKAYLKYPNEKVVGVYEIFDPVLVIRDPKIIEKIMVRDFQYFTDHTQFTEDSGLFAYGLFQMRGNSWRAVRHKISPAFTSGKLKGMFPGMLDCTDKMIHLIDQNLGKDYAIRDAIAIYTIDVIANTVFGIHMEEKEIRDEFVRMGTSIFNTTPKRFIQNVTLMQFPKIATWLGMSFLSTETQNYFKQLIKNTLKLREHNNIQRNDYTQQLLNLKKQGKIELNKDEKEKVDEYLQLDNVAPTENIEISDDLLTGQAFQFLSAGFDPLLLTTVYVLYDLALNPQVQERAREHIKEILDKSNGFSYSSVQDMTYLEQCIQETLRVHVLTAFLFRECTKKYYLSEVKLEIYKGQKVIIPIGAIQMDPKYHQNPQVYNPERLEANTSRNEFTYLPFGDGPRMCIGIRYALVVLKLGLAKLLTNYKFAISAKTKVPFDINKKSIILLPKDNILLNVTKV